MCGTGCESRDITKASVWLGEVAEANNGRGCCVLRETMKFMYMKPPRCLALVTHDGKAVQDILKEIER